MTTIPRPNLELVIQLYGSCLPDYIWMLRNIETDKKWLRFSPRLNEFIKNLRCEGYPQLYQDEKRIETALFRAIFPTDDDICDLFQELASLTVDKQTRFLNDCLEGSNELGQLIDEKLVHIDDLDLTPEGQKKAKLEFDKLSPEEQQLQMRFVQCISAFGLASFYNFLSVMVHGRKLTQLVPEAMQGNDESFCLAVHIDKSIIHQIPYFKDRFARAQQEGDEKFLSSVSYRLQSPQLKGRVRHRLLYMLFAILEATQWLNDLKHREILDICDQLELDRYDNRIETENALTKRLNDYREAQKINRLSMP